ncbi:hypothetical protein AVEN_202252-1 [Araneus ventricosus]|uniref:Uncharacterized protein n=1 Tax=Araneus ventricosus TaxID=182803 RepID=A0A4Y2CN72_ARAVE|nr:hypothetical protein AVEN_202252-1 [Araneus ventricosus]
MTPIFVVVPQRFAQVVKHLLNIHLRLDIILRDIASYYRICEFRIFFKAVISITQYNISSVKLLPIYHESYFTRSRGIISATMFLSWYFISMGDNVEVWYIRRDTFNCCFEGLHVTVMTVKHFL